MTDVLTRKQRSYNMSQIKGKNTKPEVALRRLLFSRMIRCYRVNTKLFGKPDIVFPKYRIVVFVDGCFWHKCPKCFIRPRNNRKFWDKKISGNVRRDRKVNRILKKEGWKVIRLWEHLIRTNINNCYILVAQELKKRGSNHDGAHKNP